MSEEAPRAKKRFGQHFLTDQSIVNAIVRRFNAAAGEHVIEIGPGPGALTGPLLKAGARVTAVELDRDMQDLLERKFAEQENFTLVSADVLKTDIAGIAAGRAIRIIGNLPYNITSPIIFHLLECLDAIGEMYFMMQKEVAERISAAPGNRSYGKPSVMVQRRCECEMDLVIPPEAFRPPPRVMSAMLRLRPRVSPLGGELDDALLERLVSAAFAKRRKTLRNALREFAPSEAMERVGIDPTWRAENVDVEGYARLAREIETPAG
jgi:16S rRNA (adenine1518-N6/adenine1519-N6)-dimethyltransferase